MASGDSASLRATVRGTIAPGDPGSWVRHASWHEFLLEITNAGAQPVTIRSISLLSDLNEASRHTTSLEELSAGTAERLRSVKIAVGGAGAAGATVGAVGWAGVYAAGTLAPLATAATLIAPVAAIGAAGAVAADSYQQAKDVRFIQEELLRRGLALPKTLQPAVTGKGSAFFSLSPKPARIVVGYESEGSVKEASIDVAAIAWLKEARGMNCRWSRVLDEPDPLPVRPPLLVADDGRIAVTVEAALTRNSPGSWASNAAWDEYLLRVRSMDSRPRIIGQVILEDSTGRRFETGTPPCTSAVKAPANPSLSPSDLQLLNPYFGLPLVAVAAASAAATGPAWSAVTEELERRQSRLPLRIDGGADSRLDLFFPFAPQPVRLSIGYEDDDGPRWLHVDTREALARVHDEPPPLLLFRPPLDWPVEGIAYDSPRGHVAARLTIDPAGRVTAVEFLDSSPGDFYWRAAMRHFAKWRYSEGSGERRAPAKIEFRGGRD